MPYVTGQLPGPPARLQANGVADTAQVIRQIADQLGAVAQTKPGTVLSTGCWPGGGRDSGTGPGTASQDRWEWSSKCRICGHSRVAGPFVSIGMTNLPEAGGSAVSCR